MQVSFLNIVLDACRHVLLTMTEVHMTTGKPEIKKKLQPETGCTVTGIICMRGKLHSASIAIIFSEESAQRIALRVLPESKSQNQFLAFDLVGEISNQIIGGAKAMLIKEGYNFQITLPTVISGYDYLIAHQTKAPVLRIPLNSDFGTFFVEASFDGPPLTEKEKLNKPSPENFSDQSNIEIF